MANKIVKFRGKRQRNDWIIVVASAAVLAGCLAYILGPDQIVSTASGLVSGFNPACRIKGNVSINSGERIYHVPGQHYYDETVIRFEYGERYFCTEAEARAAGWRRAGY